MWLTPSVESMKTFDLGWIAFLFVRNIVLTTLFFGGFHLYLYGRRKQGTEFKYNGRWLDNDNPEFLFRDQLLDNLFWTFVSGVPIWTAYEV